MHELRLLVNDLEFRPNMIFVLSGASLYSSERRDKYFFVGFVSTAKNSIDSFT